MPAHRPNVVLVITDQQRRDTIRAAGQKTVWTPALDRLISEGVAFTNAFCSCPMCSPSRASILTGLFPHSHGLVANHQARPGCDRIRLRDDVPVLVDYMGPSGYRSAYIGKWHLGTGSDRRGFRARAVRFGDGEGDTSRPEDNDYYGYTQKIGVEIGGKRLGKDPDPELFDTRTMSGPSLLPLADHVAMFTSDRAVDFLRESAGRPEPFLLVYSTIEPHPPFVCPEPFFSLYDPDDVVLPRTWRDESGQKLLKRADWQLRSALEYSEPELRKMWAAYLGTVSYIDYLVGRILQALVDTDQLEDTLFIFTSDHGEMLGSHGLLMKGASFYEELIRVPLVMRLPGRMFGPSAGCRPESRRPDALISQVDLVPTILSLCGLDVPEGLEGINFSNLVKGDPVSRQEDTAVRKAVPAEFHSSGWSEPMSPLRMWRTAEWKYVESKGGDHELYHLTDDFDELINLAGGPVWADVQQNLASELHTWCRETGDTWPEVPVPSEEEMNLAKRNKIRPVL